MTKESIRRKSEMPGLVANAYLKQIKTLGEEGGGLGVLGYPHLHSKIKVSLSYMKSCLIK